MQRVLSPGLARRGSSISTSPPMSKDLDRTREALARCLGIVREREMSSTHQCVGAQDCLISRRACPRDTRAPAHTPESYYCHTRKALFGYSCVQKRTCPAESQSTCAFTLSIAARTGVRDWLYARFLARTFPRVVHPCAARGDCLPAKDTCVPLPRQRERRPSKSGSIDSPVFYQGTELELRASRNDGRAGLDAYFLTSVACVVVELGARVRAK